MLICKDLINMLMYMYYKCIVRKIWQCQYNNFATLAFDSSQTQMQSKSYRNAKK